MHSARHREVVLKIEVLGTGCPKCEKVLETVQKAVAEAGVIAEVVKITNIDEMMKYGVMITPALVIDGKVIVSGRVPEVSEIKKWIAAG